MYAINFMYLYIHCVAYLWLGELIEVKSSKYIQINIKDNFSYRILTFKKIVMLLKKYNNFKFKYLLLRAHRANLC